MTQQYLRTLYRHTWYDFVSFLFFCFCTELKNVDQYVSQLARYIEDNEPALVVARADRLVDFLKARYR